MSHMHQFVSDLLEQLKLEENKLLIKEDVAFIKHFLLSSTQDEKIKFSPDLCALNISLLSGIVIGGVGLMTQAQSYGVFDIAAISGASLSLYVIGNQFITRYHLKKITTSLQNLCQNMTVSRTVIKDLLVICQESEAIERRNLKFTESSSLKNCIASICGSMFENLRQVVLRVREKLPLPFKEPDESSSLSSLPIETFSELLTNENVPTISQLKSLSQLIRLQISELLRRILCALLFCESAKQNSLKKLSNELCSIAVDFVAENKPKIKELSSLKSYYEALWNSDPVDSSKHGVRKNEDFMLCAQTARTSLRSSLSRLNNAVETCDDIDDELHLCKILDETVAELMETVDLLKSYQIHVLKNHQDLNAVPTMLNIPQEPMKSASVDMLDVEEEKQDYEVFEDLNLTNNEVDYVSFIHDEWDFKKTIGLSVNLNQELKEALLLKAHEHRERVSNALGVPLEDVPSQLLDKRAHDSIASSESLDIPSDREIHAQRRQDLKQSQDMFFNFPSQLANIAAMKSKKFFTQETECFGDEESDFENDDE